MSSKLRIIVTGLVGLYPVGGVAWDYLQYAIGLLRLGHDVYYHEDTWSWSYHPLEKTYTSDGSYSAKYIRDFCKQYAPELTERWHYLHLHSTSYGMNRADFDEVAQTADVFLNVSGACIIPSSLSQRCVKIFLDTDPGYNQLMLSERFAWSENVDRWCEAVAEHDRYFTYAENIHSEKCLIPHVDFQWKTTRMPVVINLWEDIAQAQPPQMQPWTTVMTWNAFKGKLVYKGVEYKSKASEFEKLLSLPEHTSIPLKVAVGGVDAPLTKLASAGWQVLDGPTATLTPQSYQEFIANSRGELSPAKHIYVEMCSGWFSCRSACYLAAGRPVVVQDTGLGNILRVGEGLLTFTTQEEAIAAIDEIEANYTLHAKAARNIAHEYFDSDKVLSQLLDAALSQEAGGDGKVKSSSSPLSSLSSSSGLSSLSPQTQSRLRIIILGYIVRGPLGGMAWSDLHYMMGLASLGHDVYFVEDSDDYPSCYDPVKGIMDTDPTYGLKFATRIFEKVGLGEAWAYYDAHTSCWHGPCANDILSICKTADIVLNLAGVNPLRPWLMEIPARAFIDKDPVFTQIRHLTDSFALNRAKQHTAFFSFGENIDSDRSTIPKDGLPWQATRHPIFLDAWSVTPGHKQGKFTTVMLWDSYPAREYNGQHYGMKSDSFTPYLNLPEKTGDIFDLAVGSETAPRALLSSKGWTIRDPHEPTLDPWTYQRYIQQSKAEFSIAKHGYVVSRSGWFSERSAAYLASGRPVLVQETGFSDWLQTESGVIPFNTPEEAIAGIEEINSHYEFHACAAREIAQEYFDSRKVLTQLLNSIISGVR